MRRRWYVSCLEFLGTFAGGMPGHVVLVGHGARTVLFIYQPDPRPSFG